MVRNIHLFLAMAAFVCLASTAAAQGPGAGGPSTMRGPMGQGGPGMMGNQTGETLLLLRFEPVQKDLELVDDQKAKLKQLGDSSAEEMRKTFAGIRDLSQEERRAKIEAFREKAKTRDEDMRKKVEEILLPQQVARLKEIRLQIQGFRALRTPELAKELGLSAEQQEKLKAIEQETRSQMEKTFAELRDLSQEERRAKMTSLREKFQKSEKEVGEKMLGVLTADQQEKFEKMKGKKIEIDLAKLMQRPNRGGQPTP